MAKRLAFLQKLPSCFLAETKLGQTLVHFLNTHAFKSCIEVILLIEPVCLLRIEVLFILLIVCLHNIIYAHITTLLVEKSR